MSAEKIEDEEVKIEEAFRKLESAQKEFEQDLNAYQKQIKDLIRKNNETTALISELNQKIESKKRIEDKKKN